MQIVFISVCEEGRDRDRERGREREREAVSSKEAERKWQTWPEERKGAFEKDNPWETARWTRCPVSTLLLPPSPPCVLRHGYQTGLPMQPVNVFFSGRSELGTNVSQSVSCTINVNCPGMHKHMAGGEPGNTEPPWLSVRVWKTATSPEKGPAPKFCSRKMKSDNEEVLFVFRRAGGWCHMLIIATS